ncbi:MAG: hypothetical protein EHM45_02335 [Desulfobacteraceae bacterium]|nr:MAG: hypothetical protein EHM45_02335 [Desulfobacteraceae bacterium]
MLDKKFHIILLAIFILSPVVWAKRIPAPKVDPVVYNSIQYVAPNDDGRREYVQAIDVENSELIKEITVKKNRIWFWIEEDVQWFYIIRMAVKGDYLIVTDEKNRIFKVKLLKKH